MTLRRIRFRQTGGFAGLVRACELAPEILDARDRARLERLLRQSGLAETPATVSATRGPGRDSARDLMRYEIEIETTSGTVLCNLDDLDLPERAAPLLAFLQERARPEPIR